MNYEIGDIFKAKIIKVWKNNIILQTKEGCKCFLSINEVSDYYISDLKLMFKINDIKEVQVIEIMSNNDLVVSFKRIHPKELRNPFEFKLDSQDAEFDGLLEFTNKGINYGK
ncbi:S1 RNA-binding domain-containing protein [Metamycoplasma hominis]|uniref:S1 RNA-binding domain-containing protein n=1 Tax=Metamycoplasma hominis TaxID=2098 RepID=UPI00066CE25D|nr:S1 RNA-binding domain-containing protein [Metamycoplasma hominis]